MELILVVLLDLVLRLLNLLPLRSRVALLTGLVRVVWIFLPALKRVALENLKLAFPDSDERWRKEIFKQSQRSLAQLIVDFARLPKLDKGWADSHVDCPFLERFKELNRADRKVGIVIATGHIGSFELLSHYAALQGFPMSFIVRNSKLPRLDKWWRDAREANGNKVISRRGAVKEMIEDIANCKNVAVLFDQNVTRKHAVFVPWLGVPAATTRTLGVAAVRTRAPVMVASIATVGFDRYKVLAKDFDFSLIYDDESLSADEKIARITEILVAEFETHIRAYPGQWFWMHRRWRTRPET